MMETMDSRDVVPDSVRLPLRFDVRRLREDLARIAPEEWVAHFNTRTYEGEWSGVALRAVGGVAGRLYPDPAASEPFADTPLLERCPEVREVLSAFACRIESVRFLKLAAGARIREHRDYRLGYEDGEVRLHVPVVTHESVGFFVSGQRVLMREGECWYVNVNQPHRVDNTGEVDRIHLVLDCVLDDWLRELFARAMREAADAA
ncbi:aspartyl/asparaginyl beta-hydroxylase domain-containing protein [Archangium lansingense]|uniref:Aspartyl/asparaginyl beta-hydroxylase domain-containing protein n=1 Tax=Archangium lansingense TaxID=2995310 RepID=A0ABT4AE89_9BACT|nr:aspartyl/asparaginyl beta-hydroxylase domain-containing protein [Archangium lansinium]MCY1079996.1 aspartyl/asparaginyl beta-hydroxylase domain-containing protein [Archangium lansinium]